jgi:signal transduction histidine kinase/CheY-like chemotaxis protein
MTLPLAFVESPALRLAYVVSLHGCALLILGALCLVLRWPRGGGLVREPVWSWLGVFGGLKGSSVVVVLAWGAIDRHLAEEAVRRVYESLATPAYAALLAMAAVSVTGVRRGRWLARGVVVAGAAAGASGAGGLPVWAAAGAAAGAGVLLSRARAEWKGAGARRGVAGLVAAAAALIGLGGLETGGTAYADRFQGWTQNTLASFAEFRLGAMLAGAVLAWAALLGWWVWARVQLAGRAEGTDAMAKTLWVLPAGLIAIVAGGFGLLQTLNTDGEERVNEQYRARARLAALTFPGKLAAEEWTEQLKRLHVAMPEVQAVVLWQWEDGRLRTLASSAPGVGLPERPQLWSRGGATDARFAGTEVFVSEVMRDDQGVFEVASAPLADGAGWVGLRILLSEWTKAKGPVMAQATFIVVLAALLGIAVMVYLIERDLARSIQGARHRAEAESEAKSEFLAFMSHELRTPLQSVLGYADLLALSPLAERQRRHLAAIQSQGRWLLGLVNDLLDLAAIRAGRLRLAPAPFAARAWLDACAEAARPAAEAKGLALRVECEGTVPAWLTGDAGRLRQIAGNLLGNAVKFTDRGAVSLRFGYADGTAELAVADTGPGVAAGKRAKLFQPFERLTTGKEGTGLGLALTRRLCEALGGTVACADAPGGGAVFTVQVPLAEAAGPAETGRAERTSARPLRVLVVDDHALIRELLVNLLSRLGHEADTAADGEQGVAACAARRYDAVLLDLRMPGIDGIEAGRRIAAGAAESGGVAPRLVGLSAEVRKEERERAVAAGFAEFLVKPVPLEVLAEWFPPVAEAEEPAQGAETAGVDFMTPEARARWREARAAELPVVLAKIEAGLAAEDWETVAAEAHRLKNGAWADGDEPGMDAAGAMLAAAERRDGEEARKVFPDLRGPAGAK